jgi:8-oxo-dGTP diphosphatase
MPNEKSSKRKIHYSVGALIKKDNKYLLIDRNNPPFGFACIAGHVDEGETPIEALKREVKEESNLEVKNAKLLFKEKLGWNWCSKGVNIHYWYVFECSFSGNVRRNKREAKLIGWYTKEEIKKLKLEPVWEYWFKKLKII